MRSNTRHLAVSVAIVLAMTTPLHAGPFGLDLNKFDPVSSGCVPIAGQPGNYECTSETIKGALPPFASYGAYWAPSIGLCTFRAILPNPNGKRIGGSYQAKVSKVLSALIERYGDKFYSIRMPQELSEWRTDVMLSWDDIEGEGFNSIGVNYYDGLADGFPSLPFFEAGLQVTYHREFFKDCIFEAAMLLQNDLHLDGGDGTGGLDQGL